MYKMCKTEQSAQRQRELEQGLLAVMLSHHYEEVSVSDLCDHIGIPRKSFYRYFSGKDGALHALIDHTLLEFEGYALPARLNEKRTSQRDLERFFWFWQEHKELLDALQRSGMTGVLFQRCLHHALDGDGVPPRFLPHNDKVIREYAALFGICGLMSLVTQWHQGGFTQSPWQMAQITAKLMTEPLFQNADKL